VCVLAGLRESDIMDCVSWMRPFAHVLGQQQRAELKKFPQVATENSHNIQTHVVSLELLVRCLFVKLNGRYNVFIDFAAFDALVSACYIQTTTTTTTV